MKRNTFHWIIAAIALLLCAPMPAQIYGQRPSEDTYARRLIDVTLKKHPEVVTLAMHVTPPNSADNVIIASNFGALGKKADDDDLGVLKTGKPRMEVGKKGDRFSVELPLKDVSRNTVGVLAVAFPYKPGESPASVIWWNPFHMTQRFQQTHTLNIWWTRRWPGILRRSFLPCT